MTAFACEHITRAYAGRPVVEDVSLQLSEREIVSLVGRSGVGKTTLLNVLAGVDVPDTGRVLLRGEDITGCAGRVGYMLQKDLLLPHKTIEDNVSLPLVLHGASKKAARAAAAPHFDTFGLRGYEKKYPSQLSGGMRQRAALLRTYLNGTDVILLDEPFSALDALTKRELHSWYLDIIARIGAATLFITHDIEEAICLSDRVCVLGGSPGRITSVISIEPPRPRPADFAASPAFMESKRLLHEALGL